MTSPLRHTSVCLVFASMTALSACSNDSSTGPEDKEPVSAETDAPSKDVFGTNGYKADCIDCAPDGPNAFIQLQLGDRFWQVGDAWKVAYTLQADTRTQMQPMGFQQAAKTSAGLIVLDFEVIELGSHATGGLERETATIRITQGEALGSLQQLIAPNQVRADELTARVDLTLDDLLRPVSVTEFSGPRGTFPNGREVQLDPRESVRSLETSFPYVVPNAHLGAEQRSLPDLPVELSVIAERARADYAARSYFHFDLNGRGLDSAEQVWWATGDLWPFLVQTPHATGVLIWQSK